jgi:hypothetical protein
MVVTVIMDSGSYALTAFVDSTQRPGVEIVESQGSQSSDIPLKFTVLSINST